MNQTVDSYQKIFHTLDGKFLDVNFYGEIHHTNIHITQYGSSRIAILLQEQDGEPFGTLTVNLPDEEIEDGEIIVKTWSGNEPLADAAMKSGLFSDTGKRLKTGFVEAQIWRIK
jgi:hypothetical protein